MEYIKVTSENIEKEHICCALSNTSDIQVADVYKRQEQNYLMK